MECRSKYHSSHSTDVVHKIKAACDSEDETDHAQVPQDEESCVDLETNALNKDRTSVIGLENGS